MVRLKIWQWVILALPIAVLIGFLLTAAGTQIHQWRLDWIWAVILLVFLGWRFLLAQWLKPPLLSQIQATVAELEAPPDLPALAADTPTNPQLHQQAQAALEQILLRAREDVPPWEDWTQFFNRCREVITAIAHLYNPQVKRPLLQIYLPQAYGLLRGTVDDVDRWMQQLAPVLGQVTVGQAYEAYETYQKLEPAARIVLQVWSWGQWVLNPAVALARSFTQNYSNQANQQLLSHLGQILREETLKALGARAIALYSGQTPAALTSPPVVTPPTQTLEQIFAQTADPKTLEQQPLNLLLVGRTGAGKSSLINTLFLAELAAVDLLPTTDRLQVYPLTTPNGDTLNLWDTPGYEQVGHPELRDEVLAQVRQADALLLVTPANDPALQMDRDFLQAARATQPDLAAIAVVTQVDRLRPLREWQPPYDWEIGDRPKEISIREAVAYRREVLGSVCTAILPLVTSNSAQGRLAWGVTALSDTLVQAIAPAKQFRLARFLRDRAARIKTAARIIDRYRFQMGTTQGLTALLKSPILTFISQLMTGSPTLGILLAEKIPVDQLPVVLGKLQMAYELFGLLAPPDQQRQFDLQTLWPLLLERFEPVTQDAWAFGHLLVEYWTGTIQSEQLSDRYRAYLNQAIA